jgi:signal transduction histidine kinase
MTGATVPDPSRLGPATIALTVILITIFGVAVASALVSQAGDRRRQNENLTAIDFVRASFVNHFVRGEPMGELLLHVVEALRAAMQLDSAEIWLADSTTLRLVSADPGHQPVSVVLPPHVAMILSNAPVSGRPWLRMWLPALLEDRADAAIRIAPIAVEGELIGLLVVVRAGSEGRLSADADHTLEELVREIGSALKKERLDAALHESMDRLRRQAEDLRASRARIVAAADAERRRIERDLHDGAQQYLVAIAVKANLIRQLHGRDEAKGQALLQDLILDIEAALDELRDLAHGIYPPLLSSGGLPEALAAACRRGPLPTTFEANGIGRYPPEIEAAVYFCCLEGLQNAAKYAGDGATACVAVREEAGGLIFEVRDDGVGFDRATTPLGAGITNMEDRVGAVGGRLSVDSRPGNGTRVMGTIPLADVP